MCQAKPSLVSEVLMEPKAWVRLGLVRFLQITGNRNDNNPQEDGGMMNRHRNMMFGIATASTLALLACASSQHGTEAHAATSAPHWSYTGAQGPSQWGDLSPDWALCKSGKSQSPIDITGATKQEDLAAIAFHYAPSAVRVVNNGHAIQANYDAGSYIEVDGERFELLQFHFHSPSENIVEGTPYPVEMHLVHKSASGALAVVAVFFSKGAANTELEKVWALMPNTPGAEVTGDGQLSAEALLPPADQRGFWRFSGSLTTPPCSEGVIWSVMRQPLEVSEEQVGAFLSVIHENARPPMPLNGRQLAESP